MNYFCIGHKKNQESHLIRCGIWKIKSEVTKTTIFQPVLDIYILYLRSGFKIQCEQHKLMRIIDEIQSF